MCPIYECVRSHAYCVHRLSQAYLAVWLSTNSRLTSAAAQRIDGRKLGLSGACNRYSFHVWVHSINDNYALRYKVNAFPMPAHAVNFTLCALFADVHVYALSYPLFTIPPTYWARDSWATIVGEEQQGKKKDSSVEQQKIGTIKVNAFRCGEGGWDPSTSDRYYWSLTYKRKIA